jgi:cell shape-determining protein MreC
MNRFRQTTPSALRGPIACCALALVAMSLGTEGESCVRSVVRDASLPGLLAGEHLRQWRSRLDLTRWPWTQEIADETGRTEDAPRDDAVLIEIRRLRYELAEERAKLAALQASLGPLATSPHESIKRVSARLLFPKRRSCRAGGLIVGAGGAAGIESDTIALEPIVLSDGQNAVPRRSTVLAGAAVVGKTEDVGAWTSKIVAVSDPGFRAHVRLVRQHHYGVVMGEQGVLEGDGRDGCVVKYVPSTAAVEVGDHVYSCDPTGRIPQPLYYGQIVRAALRPGAPHWEIRVRPAVNLAELSEVQVLLEDSPVPQLAADQ